MFGNSLQQITYSRLFIFDKRLTVREVKMRIFAFFRPIIKNYDFKEKKGMMLSEE